MTKPYRSFPQEQTLDPEDWDRLTALGHNMLDDVMGFLKNIREHKIEPLSDEAVDRIQQHVPRKPQAYEQVYKEFSENIFPFPVPGVHTYFWGFVMGTGSPL